MAQPQLIGRYLIAIQDNLGQAPDAGDILAEVEDHLRETATRNRHDGLDPEGAETRALQAFGSPGLVARAFADARSTKGLAMPTRFTRRGRPGRHRQPAGAPAGHAGAVRRTVDHLDHRLVFRRQQRHPHRPRSADGGHGGHPRPSRRRPWPRRAGRAGAGRP